MDEKLKIIISAEINKLKENVEKAKKEVKSFQEQVKKASDKVDENFKTMGDGMKKAGTVIAGAIAAVGAALIGLGASTAEYRAEQAKLTTAFESAGSSAAVAKDTYNDLYRVLGDSGQAVEAANHLAKLTTEEKALSEWTNICQGVYATFGASLPIESLTEAANEVSRSGQLTGALSDALLWCGVQEEDFQAKLDACNTEAERESLIRETLNGLYTDAAAKYEENNAQVLAQNDAQAKLQETTAALGEAVAPVVTAFTNFANQALDACMPYIRDLAENLMPSLQDILDKTVYSLEAAFGWIEQNKTVLAVMAGIITGIAAAITLYNTVAAIKAAMAALEVTTVWGLVAAYAAQAVAMAAAIAPYLLVVAAIAAVIAIIVLCIKHWDKIVEVIKKALNVIVDAVKVAVNWVIDFFKKLLNWVKDNWQGLLLLIVNPFAGAFKLAYDNCEGFRTKVDNFVSKIKDLIAKGFSFVKDKIVSPIKEAFTNVKNIFSNIVSTISEKLNLAKTAVSNIISAIKSFFSFTISWPKIPMPHFGISPSGWKIGDLLKGSIPKLSINWYAEGGVFDKPTLFSGNGMLSGLGEHGAEAVVPLENNLGWLNKLADMLNKRMGNNPVVLTVDGKVFAQTAINTINQQTRQTGKLQLKLI